TAVLHLRCQCINHAIEVRCSSPGEIARGAEPSKWPLLGVLIDKIGQAADIFGNRLHCSSGIYVGCKLQLEALDFAGECGRLDVSSRNVTQERSDLKTQKNELIGGQVAPEAIFPCILDIG